MSVRCKFKVVRVSHCETSSFVELTPVMNGSKENEQFFKYTPGGKIELNVVDTKVAASFNPGGEVFVDFTSAD